MHAAAAAAVAAQDFFTALMQLPLSQTSSCSKCGSKNGPGSISVGLLTQTVQDTPHPWQAGPGEFDRASAAVWSVGKGATAWEPPENGASSVLDLVHRVHGSALFRQRGDNQEAQSL